MGIGKRLKEWDKNIKIVALEPDKMPLISQNKIIGNHKIEGIGDDFIPDLLEKNLLDKTILINDEDAINISRKLAKELGLGAGISSGANFLAGVETMQEEKAPIVTVFADDNKKYLSTDLLKPINPDKNLLSNKIELVSYETIS